MATGKEANCELFDNGFLTDDDLSKFRFSVPDTFSRVRQLQRHRPK
jgi:hypothetical protein